MKEGPIIGGKEFLVHKGMVRTLTLRDELSDSPCDPESLIEQIRRARLPFDLFSFLQKLPDTSQKFPYYMEWDNLAVLTISSYENWLRKQVHPNTRTNIRKAARRDLDVHVEPFSDELAAGLVTLFNETPIRRGKRYPYFGYDVAMVKRTWATQLDQSLWVVAYYQGELVGFIKLIMSEGLARTSGTVAREDHRDKCPMNAIFAKCVELCASRGVRLLVYGKFTYGRNGEDSLTAFKKRNGFRKIEVPRYYIPLSRRGCVGLRLGLHRELVDWVPEPLSATYRKVRALWYSRKFPGPAIV